MPDLDPIVVPTIKVLLPRGIDYIWNKIIGKKILLCGMPRAGKTSFRDYLTRGLLLKERPTEKTVEHEKIRDTIIQLNK